MTDPSVYPAIVQNKAQLAYNSVAAWLDKEPGAQTPDKIQRNRDLQSQLALQDKAASWLRARRHQAGALTFHTTELQPIMTAEGVVTDLLTGNRLEVGLLGSLLRDLSRVVLPPELEAFGGERILL